MSKIGVELRIDVTKIDKSKLYQGAKGTYLTMTAFIDLDNKDEYGNNGMITEQAPKGEQGTILGNSKIFWSDNQQNNQGQQQGFNQPQSLPTMAQQEQQGQPPFTDDVPF